jgi:hypothetical protein
MKFIYTIYANKYLPILIAAIIISVGRLIYIFIIDKPDKQLSLKERLKMIYQIPIILMVGTLVIMIFIYLSREIIKSIPAIIVQTINTLVLIGAVYLSYKIYDFYLFTIKNKYARVTTTIISTLLIIFLIFGLLMGYINHELHWTKYLDYETYNQ